MSFKAVLDNISVLRDSITAVAELISEGTFVAKAPGISFTATDPTMVALVSLEMKPSVFKEYKVDSDTEISVNLGGVLSVIKRAGAKDVVALEVQKGSNKMEITLSGQSTRKFTVPLLDIEKGELPEMKLDFPATIEIKTSTFSDGIADASIVGDTVIMSAKDGTFNMAADGDTSNMNMHIDKNSEGVVAIKAISEARSKFSLDYLKKIEKASKLSDTVKLYLGKDYPLKAVFKSPDKVEITYILAPRVED